MRDEILITLTNKAHFEIVKQTFRYLRRRLPLKNPAALSEALHQLLSNVVEHAYKDYNEISLTVRFTITSRQLQIDVEDAGLPFDFSHFMSEPIDQSSDHAKGFYRIYDLVDRFWFTMLKNKGKCFSVIQSFEQSYDVKAAEVSSQIPNKKDVLSRLLIRSFIVGDGDGIAKLIYRNYDYTYYKTHFYEPEKIRSLNANKEVYSIVAEYDGKLIGHFAMVMSKHANIAEIGIATVDPRYKKMGIMNKMFDFLIDKAKGLKINAFYGEAIMMHPYSQKANLSHGMIESAIILGEVPSTTEIEHSIKIEQRSGALIDFLIFDTSARYLAHTSRYHKHLEKVYMDAGISLSNTLPVNPHRKSIAYYVNKAIDIGTIIIEEDLTKEAFVTVLDELHKEHCDMIYADINLQHINTLDTLIEMLNQHGFFYSGLLFSFYHNEDYLRLQRKNSKYVDDEQLVCYSSNARAMLDFIKTDEKRIRG